LAEYNGYCIIWNHLRYFKQDANEGVRKKMKKSERNGSIGAIIGGAVGVSVPIAVFTSNYFFILIGLLVAFILITGLLLGMDYD
jgi:hypothetical protein